MIEIPYKFTLIISQYIYSRHYFIVKHDENFIENAKKFAIELMAYKRESDSQEEIYIGDLQRESKEISQRYNINDSGDIYFLQSNYANYLMGQTWRYQEDSRRESKGFQKKSDFEVISNHHNYKNVKEIVEKYFELS